jgi:hypothetical protein
MIKKNAKMTEIYIDSNPPTLWFSSRTTTPRTLPIMNRNTLFKPFLVAQVTLFHFHVVKSIIEFTLHQIQQEHVYDLDDRLLV